MSNEKLGCLEKFNESSPIKHVVPARFLEHMKCARFLEQRSRVMEGGKEKFGCETRESNGSAHFLEHMTWIPGLFERNSFLAPLK